MECVVTRDRCRRRRRRGKTVKAEGAKQSDDSFGYRRKSGHKVTSPFAPRSEIVDICIWTDMKGGGELGFAMGHLQVVSIMKVINILESWRPPASAPPLLQSS